MPRMRLKTHEIERLARSIIDTLHTRKLFIAKVELPQLRQRVIDIMQANMEAEVKLEAEVKAMMGQFEAQIQRGEVEYHRMYQMIKTKLAKERKFVL